MSDELFNWKKSKEFHWKANGEKLLGEKVPEFSLPEKEDPKKQDLLHKLAEAVKMVVEVKAQLASSIEQYQKELAEKIKNGVDLREERSFLVQESYDAGRMDKDAVPFIKAKIEIVDELLEVAGSK